MIIVFYSNTVTSRHAIEYILPAQTIIIEALSSKTPLFRNVWFIRKGDIVFIVPSAFCVFLFFVFFVR